MRRCRTQLRCRTLRCTLRFAKSISLASLLGESLLLRQAKRTSIFACPFCFLVLNKRDSNESVKKTTRCACLFKHPPQCLLKNAIYSMQTLKRIFDIILLSIVYKVSINEQFRDIGFKHS